MNRFSNLFVILSYNIINLFIFISFENSVINSHVWEEIDKCNIDSLYIQTEFFSYIQCVASCKRWLNRQGKIRKDCLDRVKLNFDGAFRNLIFLVLVGTSKIIKEKEWHQLFSNLPAIRKVDRLAIFQVGKRGNYQRWLYIKTLHFFVNYSVHKDTHIYIYMYIIIMEQVGE